MAIPLPNDSNFPGRDLLTGFVPGASLLALLYFVDLNLSEAFANNTSTLILTAAALAVLAMPVGFLLRWIGRIATDWAAHLVRGDPIYAMIYGSSSRSQRWLDCQLRQCVRDVWSTMYYPQRLQEHYRLPPSHNASERKAWTLKSWPKRWDHDIERSLLFFSEHIIYQRHRDAVPYIRRMATGFNICRGLIGGGLVFLALAPWRSYAPFAVCGVVLVILLASLAYHHYRLQFAKEIYLALVAMCHFR